MKIQYLILIFVIAVSCSKETHCAKRNRLNIRVEDVATGELLPYFSYEIETYGLANANNRIVKTGLIESGQTSLCYQIEKYRVNELSLKSDSIPGSFVNYISSHTITSERRDFVFYYKAHKKLNIIVNNVNCLNPNDYLTLSVRKMNSSNSSWQSVSKYGCLDHELLYDEYVSEGKYQVKWKVSRNGVTTEGETAVEVGSVDNEEVVINY